MGDSHRRRFRAVVVAAGAAVLASSVVLMTAGSSAQTSFQPPKTADGKANLNGIRQAINTANWDLQDHPAQAGLPQAGAIGAIPRGKRPTWAPTSSASRSRITDLGRKRSGLLVHDDISLFITTAARATHSRRTIQSRETFATTRHSGRT